MGGALLLYIQWRAMKMVLKLEFPRNYKEKVRNRPHCTPPPSPLAEGRKEGRRERRGNYLSLEK